MGVVPSTLHVKVKFLAKQGVAIVRGSQQAARQCLVAAVGRKSEQDERGETGEQASL